MEQNVMSVLKLEKLVFDKLLFERSGFGSEKDFEFSFESNLSKSTEDELYRVTLILHGEKPDEYSLKISLTGFFSFDSSESISEEETKELITKNTAAILMPYLRSELSILTAQPDVECIVLPPFNINNLMKESEDDQSIAQ